MGPKLCHNWSDQSSFGPLTQVPFDCLIFFTVKAITRTRNKIITLLSASFYAVVHKDKVRVKLSPVFHVKWSQIVECVNVWRENLCSYLTQIRARENDLLFTWGKPSFLANSRAVLEHWLYQAGRCSLRNLLFLLSSWQDFFFFFTMCFVYPLFKIPFALICW